MSPGVIGFEHRVHVLGNRLIVGEVPRRIELTNIALRSGRTLQCDPATGRILGDAETARRFWGREYRPGWEPKV